MLRYYEPRPTKVGKKVLYRSIDRSRRQNFWNIGSSKCGKRGFRFAKSLFKNFPIEEEDDRKNRFHLGRRKPWQTNFAPWHCQKIGPFSASFFYFGLFNTTFNTFDCEKICWWLDSNRGSLALEATTLPTEPQPHWPRSFLGCQGQEIPSKND